MKLEHDSAGFLVGRPAGSDPATRVLTAIKRDTGRILTTLGAPGAGAGSQSPARPAYVRTAAPSGRSAAAIVRSRNAHGQFTSLGPAAPATSGGRQAVSTVAVAAKAMAITVELQRREAKGSAGSPNARKAQRDSNGRFLGQGGGGMLGRLGDRLRGAGGSRGMGQDIQRIDPLVEVMAPLGRTAASVLRRRGGGGVANDPAGLLGKVWREIRGLRSDEGKANRDTVRELKDLKSRSGGGRGGDALSLIPSLPKLPIPDFMLPAAGGAAVFAAAKKMLKGGGALLKRLPIIGALVEGAAGVIEDQAIGGDKTLTDAQRQQRRGENAGGVAGSIALGLAGAKLGAAGGAFLGPIGAVAGAIGGAAAGAIAGSKGGKRIGGAVGSRWQSVKGALGIASSSAGVDPGLVAKIAHFESGFNPAAMPIGKNGKPMSSAHGLGQFLDGTWAGTVRKYGEKHGVAGARGMTDAQTLALRGNTGLQAAMLAELTRENFELGRSYGGTNDAANVYALHNLGGGDGRRFLSALTGNPNASVASILGPKVIANNPSLYGNGSISVAEAYRRMGAKMDGGAQFAADIRGATASPSVPVAASAPSLAPASIPAAPSIETGGPTRLNSPPPVVVHAPAQPPAQDVRDRTIAHVVTGGVGRSGRSN